MKIENNIANTNITLKWAPLGAPLFLTIINLKPLFSGQVTKGPLPN